MLEPKFFTGSSPGIVWMKNVLSNFDSDHLTCDPALFPGKNSPHIAKSNHIFPGKALTLTDLDSAIAEVFQHYSLLFLFQPSSRGNGGSKLGKKW